MRDELLLGPEVDRAEELAFLEELDDRSPIGVADRLHIVGLSLRREAGGVWSPGLEAGYDHVEALTFGFVGILLDHHQLPSFERDQVGDRKRIFLD